MHSPVADDLALVFAGHLLDVRQQSERPSVDRRMVDRHAAPYHFFQVPVAQRVCHVPTNADQDHIDRKAHSFEVEHVDSSKAQTPYFI